MMTITQWLLLKVAEECMEVAHRAAKAAQFGLTEIQLGHDTNNITRLLSEITDFMIIFSMLDSRIGKCADCIDMLILNEGDDRETKVKRYLKMSQDLGQVEPGEV